MLTFALVLGSALLHAAWNALLSREGESRSMTVAMLAVIAVLATAGMLLAPRPWFPDPRGLAWALGAGACEGGYFVTLALALERAPVGAVYPVSRGGALVVVWPVSIVLMGEQISWASATGVALVSAGIFLAGFRRPTRAEATGVRWAVLSSCFIGGFNLLYKQGLLLGADPRALFAASMLVALPLNLLWIGAGRAKVAEAFRAMPLRVVATAVLACGSFWLFLYALQGGGAGVVLTLRNTSVVFAQAFAFAMGEAVARRQLTGSLAIALGALAIGSSG